MYIWQPNWHLFPWGVLFCLLARINSSSIFGRRVLFLAAKTGTPFHFFLLKVEWGAIFGPFRFWHDIPLHCTCSLCQIFSVYGSFSPDLVDYVFHRCIEDDQAVSLAQFYCSS